MEKNGFEVIVTTNGVEAWNEFLKPDAPKIAVIDWLMPEMDGLMLVKNIRTMETSNPPYLIMLTSLKDRQDVVKGLNAGVNDYLTKPFDSNELCARVKVGYRMIELQESLHKKIRELDLAYKQIKTLQGIVPICSICKKIRDDVGTWHQMEVFVQKRTDAEFSHSICPDCMRGHYPEFFETETD